MLERNFSTDLSTLHKIISGDLYGTCCGGNCGGYTYGKSAVEHHNEGLFNNASYLVWARGQPAEVYWRASADHRGGYAYRLCKVYVNINLRTRIKFLNINHQICPIGATSGYF